MIEGDLIQILSGLSADAMIATDHLQDLYDGQTVQTSASASGQTGEKQAGKGQ